MLKLKRKKKIKPAVQENGKRKSNQKEIIAGLEFGNDTNFERKKSSKWDALKDKVQSKGDFILGFESAQQAAQVAKRFRDVFDLPCRSYTDQKKGKFGIYNAGADSQDEEE